MNKAAVRRMIKRIGTIPEGYDQRVFYFRADNKPACGTVACLAGEAVICSVPDPVKGLVLLWKDEDISEIAHKVLGLDAIAPHGVFSINAGGWPEPFRSNFQLVEDRPAERSKVVVAYLKEALKRGTMVWEAST